MRSTIARTTRSMGLDFIRKNAIAASRRRECLRWQTDTRCCGIWKRHTLGSLPGKSSPARPMIGDKRIDAQAGKNFGVTGVLVGTGYGAKEHAEDRAAGLIKEDGSCPAGGYDAYAETLLDAGRGILGGRI